MVNYFNLFISSIVFLSLYYITLSQHHDENDTKKKVVLNFFTLSTKSSLVNNSCMNGNTTK
ncbi:hypothetical protein BD770DRAFT_400576 [Pilaira anomala]|nr:hypothetical protein BD770DRAFT_400576 [Pilaira anomala]